ncbi:MAG TPA: DinB family protein [Candidatus Limnocylindria bacterium]|nr:DinB family protein [Candidatus Limnocylindria bacterium]
MAELEALLSALDAARDDFHDALAGVDAELVTAPGVVGEWSVRDLVVHVAAWDEHGTAALELATSGRGGDFAYSTADTDAENDRIEAEALRTSPSEALAREERAFTEFRAAIAALDPAQLKLKLGNGDSVEAVIRYDGADHYAEHTEHIRDWFVDDDADTDDEP